MSCTRSGRCHSAPPQRCAALWARVARCSAAACRTLYGCLSLSLHAVRRLLPAGGGEARDGAAARRASGEDAGAHETTQRPKNLARNQKSKQTDRSIRTGRQTDRQTDRGTNERTNRRTNQTWRRSAASLWTRQAAVVAHGALSGGEGCCAIDRSACLAGGRAAARGAPRAARRSPARA